MHYFLLLLSLFIFSNSNAHETKPDIVQMDIAKNGEFIISVKTNLEAIIADIRHNNTDDSPNQALYDSLRNANPSILKDKFNTIANSYIQKFNIQSKSAPIALAVSDISVPEIGDTAIFRDSTITLNGSLPTNSTDITWQYSAYNFHILKINQNKQQIANFFINDTQQQKTITLSEKLQSNTILEYLELGIAHIIPKGLDHILFILGLFLFSAKLLPLITQISVFTVAHTITLGLSMVEIITFSAAWVEALIALSIIYIGIENILYNKLSNWRLVLILIFGLLHGMGFANVLTDIGLPTSDFVVALISFNIGVEIGQLLVVFIAYICLALLFKDKVWYRARIIIPLSVIISLVASYWLVERILIII